MNLGNQPGFPNYTNAFMPSFGFGSVGMNGGFNCNQQQYSTSLPNQQPPTMSMVRGHGTPFQSLNWGSDCGSSTKNFGQPSPYPYPSHGGDFPSSMLMGGGSRSYGMPSMAPMTGPAAQAFYHGGVKLLSVTPIPAHTAAPISAPGGNGYFPMPMQMPPTHHMGGKFY